jgi:Family of unknown function (DUF6516)
MKAQLVIRDRRIFEDGFLIEIVIWKVPEPVPPTTHGLKYSLFYGQRGRRLVGYDNERGKGDHRHYGSVEEVYAFSSLENLLDDFERDVVAVRGSAI